MSEPSAVPPPIHALRGFSRHLDPLHFPEDGMAPEEAYELLHSGLVLDGQPTLNLA